MKERAARPHHDDALFFRRARILTCGEIVDRAAERDRVRRMVRPYLLAAALVMAFGIYQPTHNFLHRHTGFLSGLAVGSWLELALCEHWISRSAVWLRDHWKNRPTHEEFPGGDSCGEDALRWPGK